MGQLRTESNSRERGLLANLIFSSRWMQLPLYFGLIVAQGVYVILFVKELWHLIHGATSLGEQDIMLIGGRYRVDRPPDASRDQERTERPLRPLPREGHS